MINFKEIGLKVGLEIHQQLATEHKLFCNCRELQVEIPKLSFNRKLRATQSELGQVDPAAMFELKKGKMIKYQADYNSACLVEADEEPPHELNMEAVESAIIIALSLGSKVVDELHTMRKIVIDGSNTTGFQRTLVVALGGSLKTEHGNVEVQTVSLEEDAARLINDGEEFREYCLDRLGVPLVEIALAPVTKSPEEVQEIALTMGRLLRATRKVVRGLGTIRQDINVSISGGKVVEVKGIQKLDLISRIIEFEDTRQHGLIKLKDELGKRGLKSENIDGATKEVTDVFRDTKSGLIRKALNEKGAVFVTKLRGFSGLLNFEMYPEIRLGHEMAELVRFYGLGGIFHSDELPAYGITQNEIDKIKQILEVGELDAFVLLTGPKDNVEGAMVAVIKRAKEAFEGTLFETRGPTPNGKTKFLRPRPGPARMYPETDISAVRITNDLLSKLKEEIPKPWEEQIEEYTVKYKLSRKLAIQLFDSEFSDLFEKVVSSTKVPASFVAATLTETLVSLSRTGLNKTHVSENTLMNLFIDLDKGRITKEAIPLILETLLKGEAQDIEDSIKKLGFITITDKELQQIVERIVAENIIFIKEKKERSFSPLMGKVMATVRGKADGAKVGDLLRGSIKNVIIEQNKHSS